MGIFAVKETFKGRDGDLRFGHERRYVRKFDVYTDSKLVGPKEVMFAVDPDTDERIPPLYDSYISYGANEGDELAILTAIKPDQDPDNWTVWHVTCEYETNVLEPPVVDWGRWTKERHEPVDSDGVAIINSAGQPFDPGVTREIGGRILIYERNQLTFDPEEMDKYSFTVNLDKFLEEGDENKWLCFPPTAHRVYKGVSRYWRARYEFHFNGQMAVDGTTVVGWDWYLLDAGFSKLNAAGKLIPAMALNQHHGQPILLDGAGGQLIPILENFPDGSDPVFLQFKKYPSKSFAGLGITLADVKDDPFADQDGDIDPPEPDS